MAHRRNNQHAVNELLHTEVQHTGSSAASAATRAHRPATQTVMAPKEQREQHNTEGTKRAAVSRVLSPFEQARALSFRAQQLSYGAKPHVDVPYGVYDSFQIAALELQQNQLRISLRRFDPSGAHKDVDVDTLIKPQTMYPDPTKPVSFNDDCDDDNNNNNSNDVLGLLASNVSRNDASSTRCATRK